MVVVGSRGLGAFRRLALGSVSSGAAHAHCPIAVIHGGQAKAGEFDAPVLLGIDGSPASGAATGLAFDEASRRGVGSSRFMPGATLAAIWYSTPTGTRTKPRPRNS